MTRLLYVMALGLLASLALAQGLVLEDDLVQAFESAPGQEVQGTLTLRNAGTEPLLVRVELADYREEIGFLPLGEAPRSLGDALRLDTHSLTLLPGGKAQVRFSLKAPPDLDGTRYAYILLTPEERREEARGNVTLNLVQRYAVLVAVSHGGSPSVRFRDAAMEGGRLILLGENEGNRLYRPVVRFQLLGKEGVLKEANLGTYTFLPGEPKRLSAELPSLPPGEYVALFLLDDGVAAYAARVRFSVR